MTKVNVQEFFKEVQEAQKLFRFDIDRATSFVLTLYKDDVDSWEAYKALKTNMEKEANIESNVDFNKSETVEASTTHTASSECLGRPVTNDELLKIHTREKVLSKEDTEKVLKSINITDKYTKALSLVNDEIERQLRENDEYEKAKLNVEEFANKLSNVINVCINIAKGETYTTETFASQIMNEFKRQKGGR